MPKCLMSEMAADQLKTLAESYDKLMRTAIDLAAQDMATEQQKKRAFRRAERTGRVIDNLLANWELGKCPSVFHCCEWEQCQRNLAIINALTPCSQFDWPVSGQGSSKSGD